MQAILGSKTRHLYNRSDCTLKNKRPKSNRSRSPLGLSPSPASSPSPVCAMFVTGRQRDDPDHGLPGSARGMPLLSSEARPLPHAPCSSLPMPPHFPLLGWVCASVCHGGENSPTAPRSAASEQPELHPATPGNCGGAAHSPSVWAVSPQGAISPGAASPAARSPGGRTESAADSRVSHRRLRGGSVAPTPEIRIVIIPE